MQKSEQDLMKSFEDFLNSDQFKGSSLEEFDILDETENESWEY